MSANKPVVRERLTAGQVRFRLGCAGVVSVVLGVRLAGCPDGTPLREYWGWLVLGGALVVFGVLRFGRSGAVGSGRSGRMGPARRVVSGVSSELWSGGPRGSAVTMRRWSERSRRNQGLASWWQILLITSALAMRRRAKVLRPSLAGRCWIRAIEVAQPLAQVGLLRIWSPVEDVTVRVGGPRVGKSGELACRILDAQGAVVATSTRTDLHDLCAPLRAKTGPVYVFNPSALGGLSSTVVFDPLIGCEDPVTASHRAGDLLAGANPGGGSSSGDREHWVGQARRVLAALMHAAVLGGASMRDVQAWVADPASAKREVLAHLRRSLEPSCVADASQFFGTNDRTQTSITTTIMPGLGWLADYQAYASTQPATDGSRGQLDIAGLIAGRGTVFLIGAEEAQTAPLVTALTGHIAREARRLAALCENGRLDPGLDLVLDEAALIAPVPLQSWTADFGGRNIGIHIGVQSFQQLIDRYGTAAAWAILTNAGTLLVFGGTRSRDDLQAYSTLSGERHESTPTWDEHGRVTSMTTRPVAVLSEGLISQLPAGRVMIVRRGMAPMIGRVTMAWKRPDVRAHQRQARRAVRVEMFLTWWARTEPWLRLLAAWVVAWARCAGEWLSRRREQRRARRVVLAAQRRARKRDL